MDFRRTQKFALSIVAVAAFVIARPSHAGLLRAQSEKSARIDLSTGQLEIRAKNQTDGFRLISVRFKQQLLKEFKTELGDWLDFLAVYSGSDATYIVLRTNLGQGACGGTDVFVLMIYESEYGKQGSRAEVSPILQKCMGDSPSVGFSPGDKGGMLISVSGFELKDGNWVQGKAANK